MRLFSAIGFVLVLIALRFLMGDVWDAMMGALLEFFHLMRAVFLQGQALIGHGLP